MRGEMDGKAFVIIGATSGVGRAIALELSSLGAGLVLTGRNKDKLNAVASEIGTAKYLVSLDAESGGYEEKLDAGLTAAKAVLGTDKFDGGVYCAGVSPLLPLRGVNAEAIEKVMRINYTCAVLSAKALASKRYRAEHTSIIVISSVSASSGQKGLGIYGASKAALEASAKAFARELAPFGVRINCISPGWLDTEMNRENNSAVTRLEQKMRELHPLGLGTAKDVSSAAVFLLSEKSKWITGANMVVDGGFTA